MDVLRRDGVGHEYEDVRVEIVITDTSKGSKDYNCAIDGCLICPSLLECFILGGIATMNDDIENGFAKIRGDG